jgi:single-strand DNA-binding protein
MLEARGIGRLVAEPTLRTIRKNNTDYNVCEFRLACQQRKNKVDFIDAAAWRGMGDFIYKHVKKGQKVFVEGLLHIPEYDKEKGRAYNPYIVVYNFEFCDTKPKELNAADSTAAAHQSAEDLADTLSADDFTEEG